MQNCNISLPVADLNLIWEALSHRPFREVHALIASIDSQVRAQQAEEDKARADAAAGTGASEPRKAPRTRRTPRNEA